MCRTAAASPRRGDRAAAQDLGARGFVGKSDFVANLIPLIASLVSDLTLQKSAALMVPHATL